MCIYKVYTILIYIYTYSFRYIYIIVINYLYIILLYIIYMDVCIILRSHIFTKSIPRQLGDLLGSLGLA